MNTVRQTAPGRPVVFSERELSAVGMRRRLSVEDGCFVITHTRNGAAAGRIYVPVAFVALLAEASSRADEPEPVVVGEVPMSSGCSIEIGAGQGAATFAVRLPNGDRRKTTYLRGEERVAFDAAIDHLVST